MKAGIDNAAHIGGLLSGFVLGIIYVVGYKFEKPDAQRTVSIIGELGIFCIFLFSFMILCKNVPPLYPEIRNEWESGIVEAYLNGELEQSVYDVAIVNPEVKPSSVIVNASLRKAFRELKIMNRPLDYKKNKNMVLK